MRGATPYRETDRLLADDPELRAGLAEIARDEEDAAKGTPKLTRLADVEPEEVEWLWPGRVPLGKISLLEGDPGLGKSTVGIDLAARVSRGLTLPGGGSFGPAPVVLLSAEDGLGDTVRPRLDAAGGDVNVIYSLSLVVGDAEQLPTIDGDLPRIERAVAEAKARLLVIDPLMAYLGGEVNSYRDQDVRRALAPLAKMAERLHVAVLVVRHLTKGGGAAAIYRGGGSIGIVGAARSALLVAKDPDDDARRIVASVKSNLAKPPASLAYRIEEASNGAPRLLWEEGDAGITADELLAAQGPGLEEGRPRDLAVAFLARYLSGGPRPSDEVVRDGEAQGVSERTLKRARKDLGVISTKRGFPGTWYLSLPEEGHETAKGATRGRGTLRPSVALFGADDPAETKGATDGPLRSDESGEPEELVI